MLLLAGAVPGFAQLTTATHVGNGKGHAAIEQAQARMGEPGVEAFTVGAITIEVEGRRLAEPVALDHQADGYLGAVGCGRPQALADVGIGIEGAEYGCFLEDFLLAAGQFQLAHLRRAIQRLVAQADPLADKLQAVLHVQAVGSVR
ncbi:hypothetical protein D3C85_1044310 [compost metagenome]